MASVRRSIAWSSAQSYVGVALQLVSTMVLSRVLTPAEVGTFAVAMVFMALAVNFRDFGIAEYLIQLQSPSRQQISAAFTVNIAMSWLMGACIFASAPSVAAFYAAPEIGDVMRVQAINFLLIPLGAINMAWLRRDMQFKPIFMASVLADGVSLVVSVVLALRGHGAMSMAWASLAGVVVTVLVSMAYRPASVPRWPGIQGLGEVVRFGGWASLIFVLSQAGRSAPEAVIGKFAGVAGAAMYSRGAGLVQIFRQLVLRAISPVCLPHFARAVRDEKNVSRAYARGIGIITGVAWPFLGVLAIEAWPAIRLVYGSQWLQAIPLAKILCLAAAVEVVHHLSRDALLAHGEVKLATKLQLLTQTVQVVGLLAVIPFGLTGACWGLLAAACLNLVLTQLALRKAIGLPWQSVAEACRPSLLVCVATCLPVAAWAWAIPPADQNFLTHLLVAGVLALASAVYAMRLTQHPLWPELVQVAMPAWQKFQH